MATNVDAVVGIIDIVPQRSEGPNKPKRSSSSTERLQAPATTGGHLGDKPLAGRTAAAAGGEPPRYPPVEGGGEVPFTPEYPPEVTEERLDHIMVGEPRRHGQTWSGGHGYGAGEGKAEFPQSWTRDVVKAAIEQVLGATSSIRHIRRKGAALYFHGTVNDVVLVVVVRGRLGPPKLWTAYPQEP